MSGKFAMISRDAEGFRQMAIAGGGELNGEDILLKPDRTGYDAKIVDADYDKYSFTVEGHLPSKLLKDEYVDIEMDGKIRKFKLADLKEEGGKTRLRHGEIIKVYQTPIGTVDEKERLVNVEIEPSTVRLGMIVSNEKQDKFWKVKSVERLDQTMHMGFPGYRGSYMNKVRLEDFPDSNHDGKRTLKLYGKKGMKDGEGNSLEGKVLLELEVTRVGKDGETFYFKLPKEERYQDKADGWSYVGLPMVNEDGVQKWLGIFPGPTFGLKLDGEVRQQDFTDVNGDGKIKLAVYSFGPGGRMKTDTHVNVERKGKGVYAVESNVGCTVGLPKGEYTRAEISADGVNFAPIASQIEGPKQIIKLSGNDLADGKVILRLVKG
jgi:hypothetical protein